MAEYFWPAGLPQAPQVSNYKHGTANNALTFKMEYGPAKTRRRASSNVSRRTWTFFLCREKRMADGSLVDQFTLFLDFMNIIEGLSFWFPDPTDPSRYIKVKFIAASEEVGQELIPHSKTYWDVSVQVEVWPNAYPGEMGNLLFEKMKPFISI